MQLNVEPAQCTVVVLLLMQPQDVGRRHILVLKPRAARSAIRVLVGVDLFVDGSNHGLAQGRVCEWRPPVHENLLQVNRTGYRRVCPPWVCICVEKIVVKDSNCGHTGALLGVARARVIVGQVRGSDCVRHEDATLTKGVLEDDALGRIMQKDEIKIGV